MTRMCSYPGCDTGSNNERQRNKLHSFRNKTLFKIPKMVRINFFLSYLRRINNYFWLILFIQGSFTRKMGKGYWPFSKRQ